MKFSLLDKYTIDYHSELVQNNIEPTHVFFFITYFGHHEMPAVDNCMTNIRNPTANNSKDLYAFKSSKVYGLFPFTK